MILFFDNYPGGLALISYFEPLPVSALGPGSLAPKSWVNWRAIRLGIRGVRRGQSRPGRHWRGSFSSSFFFFFCFLYLCFFCFCFLCMVCMAEGGKKEKRGKPLGQLAAQFKRPPSFFFGLWSLRDKSFQGSSTNRFLIENNIVIRIGPY